MANKRNEQKSRSYNRLNAYAPLLIRNNVRHSAHPVVPRGGSVTGKSKEHTSAEFGQSPVSGSATAGLDGPVMGAAGMIMSDALTEDQSSLRPHTESPPPISVGRLALVLLAIFLVGVIGAAVAHFVFHIPLTFTAPAPWE
jgi:hypothetical protein